MSNQECEISTSVKHAKLMDLRNANKAISKLKSSEVRLQFHDLGVWKNHQLCALVMQHLKTVKMEDFKEFVSYFYMEAISIGGQCMDIKGIEASC